MAEYNAAANEMAAGDEDKKCESCCDGTEILCVSIPCPIDIVVLGIDLKVELPCLRVTSTTVDLDLDQVVQLLQALIALLGGIGGSMTALKK